MKIPGVMIAAASSGSGKTVTACGMMEAFREKGLQVLACKCGPDYIDPMFHRQVLGIGSENLDLYFSEPEDLREIYAEHEKNADLTIIEGVMGYYDGMTLDSERASSYEVAKTLQVPVILVVPCRGMAYSVSAMIRGIAGFRSDSNIRGVILNRISPSLYPRMKKMLERELADTGIRIVGYIPEDEVFRLDSRHLGLVTPENIRNLKGQMERAGHILSQSLDLELIRQIAEKYSGLEINKCIKKRNDDYRNKFKDHVRIAVASDEAFNFYYQANLRMLEHLGCELVPFSPLADQKLPEEIGGLILGGGYPEEYAARLSENVSIREDIRAWIAKDGPCLAECGGFLYLQEWLTGTDGKTWPMVGAIASGSERKDRLVRFGYMRAEALTDGIYLKKGESIRGHEFHYWDSSENGKDCLAMKPDGKRSWECIHMKGNLFAGYPHLYYPSNPVFAERFVERCRTVCKMGDNFRESPGYKETNLGDRNDDRRDKSTDPACG